MSAINCDATTQFPGLRMKPLPFGNWRGDVVPDNTAFITGQTLGSLRNDYGGLVGIKITVGASDISVKELGRWVVSGNSASHTIYILNSSGTTVTSVNLATSGATAGAFKYASLTPVTLTAGGVYFILSGETSGGDQWYNSNTTVTSTAVATVNNGAYTSSPGFVPALDGTAFGPVSFKY